MKYLPNYSILFLLVILTGCSKELPRDNPLDIYSPEYYRGGLAFTTATITNDNSINGIVNSHNGVVNIDEHIQFKVIVQNTTNDYINSATAVLQATSNPDIANFKLDGSSGPTGPVTLSFGNIAPGQTAISNETIDFDVLATAKDYEKLEFSLLKKDQNGNTGTDTFSFIVDHFTPNYTLNLLQPVLVSTDQSDGKIRPGAVIKINLQENNTGKYSAYNMKCSFGYTKSYISALTPDTLLFGNILSEKTTGVQEITITLNPQAPFNINVSVELDLFDIYQNVWKQPINFTVVK